MKALVIGATGATGKDLVRMLLEDESFGSVDIFVRKGSDRFGEKAGVAILRALNAVGLMRSLRPMPTQEVAAAMIRLSKSGRTGCHVIESQDILSV